MHSKPLSDTQIIAQLRTGGKHRERCIRVIYTQFFGFVNKAANKFKLPREELVDIYTDAIIVFQDRVIKGIFRGQSQCSSYLFSIFANKCVDHIRKKMVRALEFEYEFPSHIRDSTPDIIEKLTFEEDAKELLSYMLQLGESCQKVLMDWAEGYSMKEIAERQNLKDAKVAASKKYNCLEQLKKLVET